jgi:hypothetical protein
MVVLIQCTLLAAAVTLLLLVAQAVYLLCCSAHATNATSAHTLVAFYTVSPPDVSVWLAAHYV